MLSLTDRILVVLLAGSFPAVAQLPPAPSAGPRVEPGLETAVKWIWRVEPSPAQDWGLALPAIPVPPPNSATASTFSSTTIPRATAADSSLQRATYTVKRGDALIKIARSLNVPLSVLKQVNSLATDNIRIGQILNVPTPAEVRALAPAPAPVKKSAAGNTPGKPQPLDDLETLTLQVFLDRAQFSTGPIDGRNSPLLQRIVQLYQDSHADAKDPAVLSQLTHAAVGEPLTRYTLKLEDFRFIAPPKAARADAGASTTPAHPGRKKPPEPPLVHQARPSFAELTSASMLAYRTPWEFVAERFHCDETYLRQLNAHLLGVPTVGTELRVPNVTPFAIEHALDAPLQPQPDPQNPVTAAVVDRSILQISRGGAVVAAMPLTMARPGLRGRDAWTILQAVPRPRLVSMQELRVKPLPPTRMFGTATPTPTPAPTPPPTEQILAAGPNNPVGILWIDLARAGSTEPLPYGLHGTSIPDQMQTQESLGGLRLTNWDIARAVHLLPPGTALEWKQSLLAPMPPVARPAM